VEKKHGQLKFGVNPIAHVVIGVGAPHTVPHGGYNDAPTFGKPPIGGSSGYGHAPHHRKAGLRLSGNTKAHQIGKKPKGVK
jgi:hypothetical protein